MVKTLKFDNVSIWRHQNQASGIAIGIGGQISSVNNIEGSARCHKNLYDKLDKLLKEKGL